MLQLIGPLLTMSSTIYQCRGRGSRAVLKWLKCGAVVHDASYCHPVELKGPEAGNLLFFANGGFLDQFTSYNNFNQAWGSVELILVTSRQIFDFIAKMHHLNSPEKNIGTTFSLFFACIFGVPNNFHMPHASGVNISNFENDITAMAFKHFRRNILCSKIWSSL